MCVCVCVCVCARARARAHASACVCVCDYESCSLGKKSRFCPKITSAVGAGMTECADSVIWVFATSVLLDNGLA